jgi:hypothetical protein
MASPDGIAKRDARGRILERRGPTPGAGRPSLQATERLRVAIEELLDEETLAAWQAAMRKKLAKGNSAASVFVADRLLGKPAVTVNNTMNAELAAFMAQWNAFSNDRDEDPRS